MSTNNLHFLWKNDKTIFLDTSVIRSYIRFSTVSSEPFFALIWYILQYLLILLVNRWRPWSFWMDARIYLGLCWLHMPQRHIFTRRRFYMAMSVLCCCLNNYNAGLLISFFLSDINCTSLFIVFTLVLLNPDMLFLSKQCRSRSVGFWRGHLIWLCTICH